MIRGGNTFLQEDKNMIRKSTYSIAVIIANILGINAYQNYSAICEIRDNLLIEKPANSGPPPVVRES